MHDAQLMRRRERGDHLPDQGQRLLARHGAVAVKVGGQGLAFQQLHGQEKQIGVELVFMPAQVEDAADIGSLTFLAS